MLNLTKTLTENYSHLIKAYMGDDIQSADYAFRLMESPAADFSELCSLFKSKLVHHTYIDLLLSMGQAAVKLGISKAAEEIFERIIEETADDEKLIDYRANANLELGKILAQRFLWKESLVKIGAANELYIREKNYKSSFFCEALSGLIFEEIGGYPNARKHFANCLMLVNDKNESDKMGFVFSNLGLLEFYQNNLESAISNFRRAEIYYQKSDNKQKVLELKYNLSLLYLLVKDYNNAFREIEETIFGSGFKGYFGANEKIYVNKVKLFIDRNDFSFTIPLSHNSFDLYGFRASNDVVEYIYQLKTAISSNVNSVFKEFPGSYNTAQKTRSSITII